VVAELAPLGRRRSDAPVGLIISNATSSDIRLLSLDELAPGDELVTNIQYHKQNNANIRDEEARNVPWQE